MNSSRKGFNAERELLGILHEHGIEAVRNIQKYCSGFENPDIAATFKGIKLHAEVKRQEKLSITNAMSQAVHDANGKAFPLIIHRTNRQPWLVTFRLDDFFREIEK